MAKFFDEDMNEVEAFTQAELDAKLKEAEAKFKESNPDNSKDLEKLKKDLENKIKEVDEAKERGDRLEESYKEARKKLSDIDKQNKTSEEEKQATYEKMLEDTIKTQAGDDKELAEALRERYEGRKYEVTIDSTELNKRMGEELLLTQHQLNREIKPFNPAINSGQPPAPKVENTNLVSDDVVNDALSLIGMESTN